MGRIVQYTWSADSTYEPRIELGIEIRNLKREEVRMFTIFGITVEPETVVITLLMLVGAKSIIIGGDYSIWLHYKHGRNYAKYYDSRPKFDPDVIYRDK